MIPHRYRASSPIGHSSQGCLILHAIPTQDSSKAREVDKPTVFVDGLELDVVATLTQSPSISQPRHLDAALVLEASAPQREGSFVNWLADGTRSPRAPPASNRY